MRYIRIAAALLIALCLSACGKNEDAWESDGYFMPCTNGAYLLVSNEIGEVEMNPENNDNSVFDGLTVGDKIRVSHGVVLETYPGRTDIFSLQKLSDGSIEDIPEEKLSQLEEMGWIAVSSEE